jgi:hypothetical protein
MFSNRDSRIVNNSKEHTYLIDNKEYYISVTTYIKTLFNEITYKNNCIVKNNETETPQRNGNKLGSFIYEYFDSLDKENFIQSKKNLIDEYVEYGYFLNFINDNPKLKIFKQECAIFDEDVKIAGAFDCILIHENGDLYLYDWKRCKKIWYNSYVTTKHDYLNNNTKIKNCNYWTYTLQVNFYAKILENKYNLKIKKLFITSFHPVNENYLNINVPKMDDVMNYIWDIRKNKIK